MARASMQQIKDWAAEAFAENGYPRLIYKVKFEYNERFSARMGDANWTRRRIRLSGPLFDVASLEEQEITVKHEACHIVVAYDHWCDDDPFKKRPKAHGDEWKLAMLKCGLRPDRCHDVDTSQNKRNRQRRYMVPCACPEARYEVAKGTVTRWVKDALRGLKRRCTRCRQPVRPEDAFPSEEK